MMFDINAITINSIPSQYKFHTSVDVLRLDLIHPVVSGNKWFKLKYFLQEAQQLNKKTLITYGGAYSNHIVATAAAAFQSGLKSIGIIRGEKPLIFSPTLLQALSYQMELYFIDRASYKYKPLPDELSSREDVFIIPEGGYGENGKNGAAEILNILPTTGYTHLIAAMGSGTTLAGLAQAALPQQKVIGISVLKNAFSLEQEVSNLLHNNESFTINHDYSFGGYAKKTPELLTFMNEFFRNTSIPTDFVYTGKLFFAVQDLIKKQYFQSSDRLLVIHSGGLQGNRSLSNGTLIF
jgi:1-aminocyclopropane-1-carboxylate deaminase